MKGRTDYNKVAAAYARFRKPDPGIRRAIRNAIGDAQTVVNVGAGTGSYEPEDLKVTPVEPSSGLARRHRSPAEVVAASAESLPFPDSSFDAALAILTIHHWADVERGLRELERVSSKRIVVLTWDPQSPPFWLTRDYFPAIRELDEAIFLPLQQLFGTRRNTRTETLLIPHDCRDGFLGAYWRRPELYLDSRVRDAISSFGKIGDVDTGLRKLATDLESGAWAERNGDLLLLSEYDVGYRLMILEQN